MEHEIREYRPGDEPQIVASFNRVFREVCGPTYVDRDLGAWRWEFHDNPAGHRIVLAIAPDGTALAQYAGVPQTFHSRYGDATFVHIVDSFVVPEARAGLKRPGLFVTTAYPWFDLCHAKGDAVLYGYPVRQAMRIGQRYLEYHPLRSIEYLLRELGGAPAQAPAADVTVAEVDAFPSGCDALWSKVAAEQECALRRDAAYLGWRWQTSPARAEYVFLEARRNGELAGLCVLRPVHELVPGACTIADWIVPPGDAGARAGLLAAVEGVAAARGRQRVLAVFAPSSPEWSSLREDHGFRVEPSATYEERILTHRIYHPEMTTEWLTEHWWYTLGDSDLV